MKLRISRRLIVAVLSAGMVGVLGASSQAIDVPPPPPQDALPYLMGDRPCEPRPDGTVECDIPVIDESEPCTRIDECEICIPGFNVPGVAQRARTCIVDIGP